MKQPWTLRARQRMQVLGLPQDQLAEALNCTRGAIGHYLAGRRSPTIGQLKIIAENLAVEPCWLVFGNQVREESSYYGDEDQCRVPVIGTTATPRAKPADHTPISLRSAPQTYALKAVGSDWAPRVYDGETILLDPGREPLPGDEVWVRFKDGTLDLRVLVRARKDRITLDALAGTRQRQHYPVRNIEFMHCLLGVLRDGVQSLYTTPD